MPFGRGPHVTYFSLPTVTILGIVRLCGRSAITAEHYPTMTQPHFYPNQRSPSQTSITTSIPTLANKMSSLTSLLFSAFVGAHPGELDALRAKGTNSTSPKSKPTSTDQIPKDGVDVKEGERILSLIYSQSTKSFRGIYQ